jgi:myo-inositol-1(or 4)-monophosphatase
MLKLAIKAATTAAGILKENFGKISSNDIREKSLNDFLTFVDEKTEDKIIEIIQKEYPAHSVLAEESGRSDQKSDYEWIIDPLDGTKNFITGIPIFAISIALRYKMNIQMGVIYDPIKDELFFAERNKGAFLNKNRIQVSENDQLENCLLATGFPFKNKKFLPVYMDCFQELFLHCSGMRRMGAAAIDLAYLAAGRFDGFWEIGLSPWDVAAGALIIEEAGGRISDFWGQVSFLKNAYTAASNGKIHDRFLKILQKHFREYTKIQ